MRNELGAATAEWVRLHGWEFRRDERLGRLTYRQTISGMLAGIFVLVVLGALSAYVALRPVLSLPGGPSHPTGEDWGVCPYWFLATASTAGTVEYAGEGDQALTLSAGTSNISVTPRIESPSDFTTLT